jgi:serine/threonine protein kinase
MPDLGETLGRYTLLKRLAAGGMGEIFLAARMGPLGFAPPIALKVLREELASDHQFIDMLVDEAKISMFLNHQNVVSVLDFGEDRGRYYIAMELVQGVTLKGILDGLRARNRRLDVATAVYITNELCRALKYAHTRTNHAGEPLNIVHRDVTPANVLISVQGEVKLTDFGIARAKNRVHQTQAGVLKGKFGYMAPEMLRYETIDARADIFCAGVMLYEMVAGQHPVEGASIMDAITRLEEKDVRPPSHHNPKLPRDLDAIVMKALEPRPDERWSSAAELAAALQELVLSDATRRGELRHGSESVSGLVRELFPQAFDPPLPRELSDQLFAQARKRASLPPDALGLDPDRVPTGEDLVASDPLPGRDFQREPSAVAVRPAIQLPEVRSKSEAANLPTRDAVTGLKDASTLVPPSARGEVELDTDEHAKNLLASAVAAASQRAATISLGSHDPAEVARPTFSDNATMAFSAVRGDDEDAATGEIVIRFPETSSPTHLPSDRREQLIAEPRRPEHKADATMPYTAPTREAIERAHEDERTVAQPDAFDAGRVDDGKTVTGMALPDWDALVPGRAPQVQVFEPPTSLEEPVRDFAEQELPHRGRAPSYEGGPAYDDGATAFGGPRSYNDDQTAFGMNSVSPEEPATIIPDADLIGTPRGGDAGFDERGAGLPPSQQFSDDTLLDGISKDSVDKAKAELGLHKRPQLRAPDEEPADTRLRQDALIDEAMAELSVQPKRLTGPLRVKAPDAPAAASVMPPSVSPSLGVPVTAPAAASDPFKSRTPMPPRIGGRDGPRTGGGVEVAPASKIVPLNNGGAVVGPVEIGSATGRWMRGELAANDLSWGDDAAARRAVATRNAAPGQGGPAAPARPGVGTQPGVMVPGGPGPSLVHGVNAPHPHGMGHGLGQPAPGMTNINAPPPYPLPQTAQRRASRSLTLGLAMATAAVAVAAVATVLFRTKVAWPEVTFETEPAGATVRIDERVMGERTPARFAVRPNVEHRVELQLEGYVPRELSPSVELSFFGSRTYQVALERLTPKIRVSPVAGRVFVNDTLVGTGAEVDLVGVAPGTEVKLRVEADGFIAWSQTFAKLSDVPASLDVPLSPELAPAPAPAPAEPPKRPR